MRWFGRLPARSNCVWLTGSFRRSPWPVPICCVVADGAGGLARGFVLSALALWLGAGLALRQRALTRVA